MFSIYLGPTNWPYGRGDLGGLSPLSQNIYISCHTTTTIVRNCHDCYNLLPYGNGTLCVIVNVILCYELCSLCVKIIS